MAGNYIKHIFSNQISSDFSNDASMAAETNESHLLILEDDQGRKEFSLENPIYSIGRDRDCNIRLVSQFVSRRHATLVRLPRELDGHSYYYRIVDGDAKGKLSSNGLMINGRKMQSHDLRNEDEIVFGPQVRAIYYLLRNTHRSGMTDASEYDITLINPGMTDDLEEI
ncbi:MULTISPECIES: FHA domain-containing protein [unclassified Tolypothrix]|uniref:FHA domain-containing protein n=1 Tax=unclassified Tolypothrix TaxID=2649714 RepID=UPI0005EABD23|nr:MULTISPECIES: FHA domain-containing protein [unclassified Tolypothrix]BAY92991.1 FHA domain-containing protein [Microchaete diplosiphon NIES-3275]EKF03112.1 putative forkhead-associated protein [Tolypothrix sp. PCC 7601]MBE9083808.1 FHA domain-containing protein [Tolypothrix sp. LEGE 11397]UYD26886.1 FHA domain-containing protein [Tolypothrix sp. PCC 7712]UYD37257.1 FHA domain-containing protein [Tolypothrix sp. PCC 7601]